MTSPACAPCRNRMSPAKRPTWKAEPDASRMKTRSSGRSDSRGDGRAAAELTLLRCEAARRRPGRRRTASGRPSRSRLPESILPTRTLFRGTAARSQALVLLWAPRAPRRRPAGGAQAWRPATTVTLRGRVRGAGRPRRVASRRSGPARYRRNRRELVVGTKRSTPTGAVLTLSSDVRRWLARRRRSLAGRRVRASCYPLCRGLLPRPAYRRAHSDTRSTGSTRSETVRSVPPTASTPRAASA
jgi:hypothetical protein